MFMMCTDNIVHSGYHPSLEKDCIHCLYGILMFSSIHAFDCFYLELML